MQLAVFDIGGTTIKIAVWDGQKLINRPAIKTPDNLQDFYQALSAEVKEMRQNFTLAGVAISSPGAVDQQAGIIRGSSAIPYIHNFKIVAALQKRFALPVAIENDADCAALGELAAGSGQKANSLVLLVIGTGVGGAIIINHQIWHGAHLFGGEFGYELIDHEQLSETSSPVHMANRYNQITGKNLSGKEVFALADQGDRVAQKERQKLIHHLAVCIFNVQHSIDPEKILLGGAISNDPRLVPLLDREIAQIRKQVSNLRTIKPKLSPCKLKSEANLRGAVENFKQQK